MHHGPVFFPFYHLMFIFAINLEPILESIDTIVMTILRAAEIIEEAVGLIKVTKITANMSELRLPQMDFIMLNFQKDCPINFIAAKSNHRITMSCFKILESFCLNHSFE